MVYYMGKSENISDVDSAFGMSPSRKIIMSKKSTSSKRSLKARDNSGFPMISTGD
jgi:hypothetical protein